MENSKINLMVFSDIPKIQLAIEERLKRVDVPSGSVTIALVASRPVVVGFTSETSVVITVQVRKEEMTSDLFEKVKRALGTFKTFKPVIVIQSVDDIC